MNTEDLKYVLDRTTELVRNADSKNNVMVAIIAGLAVVLFSNGEFVSSVSLAIASGDVFCMAVLSVIIVTLLVFLAALFSALRPVDSCISNSLVYAGKISEHENCGDYRGAIFSPEYSLEDDLVEQIYINAKIFKRKTRCNKIASYSLYIMILAIIVFASCSIRGV